MIETHNIVNHWDNTTQYQKNDKVKYHNVEVVIKSSDIGIAPYVITKQDYHNILSQLRLLVFNDAPAKKLLYLFEEEATNNFEFYLKLCKWLSKDYKESTVYLRDELALQFIDKFKNDLGFLPFDNAWTGLDTYSLQSQI